MPLKDKLGKVMLIVIFIQLFSACRIRIWEPLAPERSFKLEELLLDQYDVPSTWETSVLFFPQGYDLCGTDCISRQFKVVHTEQPKVAEHILYSYPSSGHAGRTFEKLYLLKNRSLNPNDAWQYQSPITNQEHFGCVEYPKPTGLFCEWAGLYEEYLVVFRTRINADEISLENMEDIVEAIDLHMSIYLDLPTDSE